MKKYFLILSGHPVEIYQPITSEVLEGRQIRKVLEDVSRLEKNRLLMIGLRSQSGEGYCIVVSLKDDNLMIYNSNVGLYRCSNLLEAKEYLLGYFSVKHPAWYASFSDDL